MYVSAMSCLYLQSRVSLLSHRRVYGAYVHERARDVLLFVLAAGHLLLDLQHLLQVLHCLVPLALATKTINNSLRIYQTHLDASHL